jgi:nucleotide-binding universal stress UspA family protein
MQGRRAPVPGPVVVGVDGSPASLAAARAAAHEATIRTCPLVVVHATADVAGRHLAPARRASHAALAPRHSSRVTLDIAAQIAREHPGLPVLEEAVEGQPADVLVDRSADADLLVVGSRGLGAVRGAVLGSVSGEVIRRAAGTVLVVHDSTRAHP